MSKRGILFIAILGLFVVWGCNTQKDAFVNRSFHAVTTKYNILYNGNIALETGLADLNANYKDDYWKVLPIEPLEIKEEVITPNFEDDKTTKSGFGKAEEKAVKAVQKHSMDIGGRQRNQQIDDAFLLLGKARYYSQRFVPALEAFNYVIKNYPEASLIDETKIWRAKTNVRLQNEEQAVETMNLLLKKRDLPDAILEKAHTAIAMAYMKMDSVQQVLNHLNQAVRTSENKEQKARNLFILGQLYSLEQKIDSSEMAFQELTAFKKAPYKYRIHAHIEMAKNYQDDKDLILMIEKLEKLIKDRDNRPYLDELYYQLGVLEEKKELVNKAARSFQKSVHAQNAKNFQKELSYEKLGDLHFEKAAFLKAGAYYDSVVQLTTNVNSKRIRRLKRRRESLEDVLGYERIAYKSDSILKLVAMTDDERKAHFQEYIKILKKADKEKAQQLLNAQFLGSGKTPSKRSTVGGKWYFYNIQTVGFGAQEFKKIWGNRALADNWRLSDKSILSPTEGVLTDTLTTVVDDAKKYEISFYLEQVPNKEEEIQKLILDRNNAYYQLGLIYKEQFKEYQLAADRLEKLLSYGSEEHLILPIYYHLYKVYTLLENEKAREYKSKIVQKYPDSKYAKIIENPEEILSGLKDEDAPENIYKHIYYDYKDECYEEVVAKIDRVILKFEDLPIISKFELLKAHAIGKIRGKEAFKKALEFVAVKYANTIEGKKAAEIINKINTPQ